MKLTVTPFKVHKRVPLTISRGTNAGSTNLWVQVQADDITGWGEATPFSIGSITQTGDTIQADLVRLAAALVTHHPLERQQIEAVLGDLNPCSAARAALDVALWDWLGKRVGLPLWQLWGLDLAQIGPTAVTVGINSPQGACDRIQSWLTQLPSIRSIKVKLGSPDGIAADQAMFEALMEQFPDQAKVSVDANGGWSVADAVNMAQWLKALGVEYLEQPLERGEEDKLAAIRTHLPVFLDESCFTSVDIPKLAPHADGINIKLMKSGGLTEARRMIHTARACGLGVMYGCYSDSAISNTALAHLGALADHLDLDSHLNLKDDPFEGAEIESGQLLPSQRPGLGLIRH
ncbi:MAG: dipeptide epimerase [Cyanobacteria bacterium J06632_22]